MIEGNDRRERKWRDEEGGKTQRAGLSTQRQSRIHVHLQ